MASSSAAADDTPCVMLPYRGYMTIHPATLDSGPCRGQELKAASASSCAQACLRLRFCESSTFFGASTTYLQGDATQFRGRCFGRAAGRKHRFARIGNGSSSAAEESDVVAFVKHCRVYRSPDMPKGVNT